MENKNEKNEKRSLESWARKSDKLFDKEEVEQFLSYCDNKLFLLRTEMVTEKYFQALIASFGY